MITREGLPPLIVAGVAAATTLYFSGFYLSLIFWVACLLLLLAYRDPERDIPSAPLAVISPADGRVIAISNEQDPWLGRSSIKVSIKMHFYPYGVFTTRSPVEGKVLELPNPAGNRQPAHRVWLKTDEDDDIVMTMSRGRLHNAPRCYINFGERVGQGQRCGFVHLGGQIDLYLPERSRMVVSTGDRVSGGSDVIANLVH